MTKFFKLFINETIKILKKKSAMILIILAILSLFLSLGFVKLIELEDNTYNNSSSISSKDEIQSEYDSIKKNLEFNSNAYTLSTLATMNARKFQLELAIKYDINIYADSSFSDNFWKNDVLEKIYNNYVDLYYLSDDTSSEAYVALSNKIDKLIACIEANSFKSYINFQKEDLKNKLDSKTIAQNEYNDELYILDLTEKYNLGEESNFDYSTILDEMSALKKNLRTGIDSTTNKVLTNKKIKEINDTLKLDEYRLEHKIPIYSTSNNYSSTYQTFSCSFAMFFVSLLGIILAGTAVSSEFAKGTIKFWLMLPAKRWKILLSKLCTIVVLVLLTTLIISIGGYIINSLFVTGNLESYLYVSNNEVKVLSPLLFNILLFLSYDIDIFVYILFALMLSVLSRNSALSVGVSIALNVGSSTIMTLINYLVKSDWIKFIPFNNMNLTGKIFTNLNSYADIQAQSVYLNNVSIKFSLCVLAICSILMLITMFDSFNKRDITN